MERWRVQEINLSIFVVISIRTHVVCSLLAAAKFFASNDGAGPGGVKQKKEREEMSSPFPNIKCKRRSAMKKDLR